MTWGLVAVAGAAVVTGVVASTQASKGAAKGAAATSEAARFASDREYQMFQEAREDTKPWRDAGAWAVGQLAGTPGTPIYSDAPGGGAGGGPTGTQSDGSLWGKIPNQSDYMTVKYDDYGSTVVPDKEAYSYALDRWQMYNRALGMSEEELQSPQDQRQGGAGTGEREIIGYEEGTATEGLLSKGPGEFKPEEDPGYKFGYEEFVKGPAEARAAARGEDSGGGRASKELTRYASDYASTKYDNFLSRYYQKMNPYFSMAGMGQVSAGQTANLGVQTGQSMGQNTMMAGQAQSSAYQQQGQIWGNTIGQTGQNAMDLALMYKMGIIKN